MNNILEKITEARAKAPRTVSRKMLEAQARLQFDLFYSPECGLWDERDI